MIPTVLGPVDGAPITGAASAREVLLHGASPSSMKVIHDNPITLTNLAEVRSSGDTGRLAASNRLFSVDEGVQELASLKDAGGGVVLDCSTTEDGRQPSGLQDIARRSGLAVVMAASCKETDAGANQPSPETIAKELEHQLLFGEHGDRAAVATATASPGNASPRIQAGFLLVQLNAVDAGMLTAASEQKPGNAAAPAVDDPAVIAPGTAAALEGAMKAHQATGAPLMIACPHFVRWPRLEIALAAVSAHSTNAAAAAAAAATAATRRIIVAGMHGGTSQSLQDQAALLDKGIVLCFDCFGRVEWLPGPQYYPSDEESAARIADLVRRGFADRIVISSGVSRRIHLSRFGGHGYAHALRTVPPRLLRLGVSAEDITLMTRDNLLRLLDWYTPPPPMEIPKDYLPCSWCKKRFEPIEGEYFHKFQFVYCGIKCLRGHRDAGFDADAAASREAS